MNEMYARYPVLIGPYIGKSKPIIHRTGVGVPSIEAVREFVKNIKVSGVIDFSAERTPRIRITKVDSGYRIKLTRYSDTYSVRYPRLKLLVTDRVDLGKLVFRFINNVEKFADLFVTMSRIGEISVLEYSEHSNKHIVEQYTYPEKIKIMIDSWDEIKIEDSHYEMGFLT